jgi:hypothetical protein
MGCEVIQIEVRKMWHGWYAFVADAACIGGESRTIALRNGIERVCNLGYGVRTVGPLAGENMVSTLVVAEGRTPTDDEVRQYAPWRL